MRALLDDGNKKEVGFPTRERVVMRSSLTCSECRRFARKLGISGKLLLSMCDKLDMVASCLKPSLILSELKPTACLELELFLKHCKTCLYGSTVDLRVFSLFDSLTVIADRTALDKRLLDHPFSLVDISASSATSLSASEKVIFASASTFI